MKTKEENTLRKERCWINIAMKERMNLKKIKEIKESRKSREMWEQKLEKSKNRWMRKYRKRNKETWIRNEN